MSYNESQKKATAKYMQKSYDDIKIRVKKGERDKIKEYAQAHGESLNSYVLRLIYADMSDNQ